MFGRNCWYYPSLSLYLKPKKKLLSISQLKQELIYFLCFFFFSCDLGSFAFYVIFVLVVTYFLAWFVVPESPNLLGIFGKIFGNEVHYLIGDDRRWLLLPSWFFEYRSCIGKIVMNHYINIPGFVCCLFILIMGHWGTQRAEKDDPSRAE